MPVLNLVQAINRALHEEMARDPRVLVLGEDVGVNGGVFRATEGLLARFGPERVVDTPLSELGIAGCAIGLALTGVRPVAEIQFDGFLAPALDQFISHAGRLRTRSRGRFTVPMVVRVPHGGGVHAPEHHSESPEVYLCHTPGIKVVIPSTPRDARGLLLSAIRDPDTVIFFEPKRIYRAIKEEVPEDDPPVPIGKARVARPGRDATVFAWGGQVPNVLAAAKDLAGEGIDAEVIDLRTLSPLDSEAIVESVSRTGRAVVVHEAPRTCGLGAEVAAIIQEKTLLKLQAPVRRVTGWDTPTPLFRIEQHYFPSARRIADAVRETVRF